MARSGGREAATDVAWTPMAARPWGASNGRALSPPGVEARRRRIRAARRAQKRRGTRQCRSPAISHRARHWIPRDSAVLGARIPPWIAEFGVPNDPKQGALGQRPPNRGNRAMEASMVRFSAPFRGSWRHIGAADQIPRRFDRGGGTQAGEWGALGPRLHVCGEGAKRRGQ